jgi:hypothetical protein
MNRAIADNRCLTRTVVGKAIHEYNASLQIAPSHARPLYVSGIIKMEAAPVPMSRAL